MTRTLLIITGLFLVAGMTLAVAAVAASDEILGEYVLGEGLTATVGMDGGIVVHVSDGVFTAPALICSWPHAVDPRLKNGPLTHAACAREGDVHGRRGFTRDADDDGDGSVDEDPLDGRDNDGDGRIDEDFAAISHAMVAWNWRHGGRSRHLETYHWSYPHLGGLLAAVYNADPGTASDPLHLTVPDATWIRTDEFCFRTDEGGAGPAFVARVPDPRRSGQWLWLGVAVLDTEPRRQATERVHAAGEDISVPLLGSTQALALVAGPTRLRVAHDLAAAVAIHAGVEDPVSGQRVSWLPAAIPATVPTAQLPAAELRADPDGGFVLALTYTGAFRLRHDPDLFQLDGAPLGGPNALTWRADGAHEASTLGWPLDGGLVDACHPYDHLDPHGPGVLTLRFTGVAPTQGMVLEGVLEDGRHVSLPVTVLATEPNILADQAEVLEPESQHLQLSPLLLSNFPNPFRSSTQVSFQIPATAGEAFLWEGEGEPPFDPHQRLPFAGGSASVSVIVYDLEGREIATLHHGILGVGQYQASWNGLDSLGRIMASGAYFCKLQIENWSVTKRLVFIR